MRKIVAGLYITLDGVVESPEKWHFPYYDADMARSVETLMGRCDAMLLGRRTYEEFAAHWPHQDPADPLAALMNERTKYVVSATLTEPAWSGTTVIAGDLAKEVTALKERTEGELQVHGSGALAQSLFAAGLVDTLHLLTFPVVLGAGRRLFPEGSLPTAFRRTGGSITSTGVSIQSYDRAGRPEYGTYELPENA